MKLVLLTNYTSNWLKRSILKVLPNCESIDTYEYNELTYQLSNPESELSQDPPNYLVVSMLWEEIENNFLSQTKQFSEEQVNNVIEISLANYNFATSFASKHGINLIMLTYPTIGLEQFSIFDENSRFGNYSMISKVNHKLLNLTHNHESVYIINTDRLIATVGIDQFYDYVKWYAIKQPFKKAATQVVSQAIKQIIQANSQARKKVLVLDLDHTMWHGTLAEEGAQSLIVGQEGIGSAYYRMQYLALKLKRKGILLAILSKNDEAEALAALDQVNGMLISSEDIAAYSISWDPKIIGIQTIAQTLNLSLDSFVFLDDNPFERQSVIDQYPEVTVLPFPDDLSKLAKTLTECRGFDILEVTTEDIARADQYKIASKIRKDKELATNFESFVKSLEMKLSIIPPEDCFQRITQLINKSNQFNMTTIRRNIDEIKQMYQSKRFQILPLKLIDKYTDHGIISIVILDYELESESISIDTFIMSCRVLGRSVEELIIQKIKSIALQNGCSLIRSKWIKTKKNQRFSHFFESVGFSISKQNEEQIDYFLTITESKYI